MATTGVAAILVLGGFADDARAATVTVSETFDGNDCTGLFGTGFGSCNIFFNTDTGEQIKLSPVIAKYEFDDDGELVEKTDDNGDPLPNPEINSSLYSSVDGGEFGWTFASSSSTSSGSWSYEPGVDDPGVKYWAAKGGNFFNLFWTVNETATEGGGACTGDNLYTLACLSEALTVTSGDYVTPINSQNGQNFGLSHLTFYNSEPPVVIPLPAGGLLLITALGGLGIAARRRRKAA